MLGPALPIKDNLISDFHQNKDWNQKHTNSKLLKLEFDFWFPPKQGLKLQITKFIAPVSLYLISDFHQNKDWNLLWIFPNLFTDSLFDFWFPPKQGLKRSNKLTKMAPISDLISDFHQNKDWNFTVCITLWTRTTIWFLISTKTRIETMTRKKDGR